MVNHYDHVAAQFFVEALRSGDRDIALELAARVTMDPDAENYGAPLEKEYNDEELANLIEANLKGIDQGRWDMTSRVYLPIVIGAVSNWRTKETNRRNDGKTSSESFEQGTAGDPSGA